MMDSEGPIQDAIQQYLGEEVAPREVSYTRWGLAEPRTEEDSDMGLCDSFDDLDDASPSITDLRIFYLDDIQTTNAETMREYLRAKGPDFLKEIKPTASAYLFDEKARQDFCLYGTEENVKLRALYAAALEISEDTVIARTYSTQDDSGLINLARYRTNRLSTEPPKEDSVKIETA